MVDLPRAHGSIYLCALLLVMVLAGCSGKRVPPPIDVEKAPALESEGLALLYTVRGNLRMRVQTSEMLSFDRGDKRYDEFPKGIIVYAYEKGDSLTSMIDAGYAIYQTEQKLWEARHHVVIVNGKNDSIFTERVFWNEGARTVYSDDNVKIKTKDAIFFGQGFTSDDEFLNWEIKRPTGMITVEPGRKVSDPKTD